MTLLLWKNFWFSRAFEKTFRNVNFIQRQFCMKNNSEVSDTPNEPDNDTSSIEMHGDEDLIKEDTPDKWKKKPWESYDQWATIQRKHSFRPRVDPRSTSIFLFPGQGSQFQGMGKQLLEYPNVPEMYDIASEILGYNLLDKCLNGPQSELDKTQFCQPAIFVTSLAAVEKLKHTTPTAIENCISAAGFSVGEIAAIVFAGALPFEQGVELIKVRAEAMQRVSERHASGMMTVHLTHSHKLKLACLAARKYCEEILHLSDPVCEIANYLNADVKVIAGTEEALQFIEKAHSEFGIDRCKRLPVSGAFHTKIMRPAEKKLANFLENLDIEKPSICVHSNVSGYKYKHAHVIKKQLAEQVSNPVKWEQIMHILYSRPSEENFPNTYEVGPGKQLGFLLRSVNKKAFQSYVSVDV